VSLLLLSPVLSAPADGQTPNKEKNNVAAAAPARTPAATPERVAPAPEKIQNPTPTPKVEVDDNDDTPKATRFNDIEVPPMTELTGEGFDTSVKQGYW
jgi:hypothetical protein